MTMEGNGKYKVYAPQVSEALDGRAFRYALSVPGIACALIGVRNAADVRRAVGAAREFRPLTDAEMTAAIRIGEKLVRDKSSKVAMLRQHFARDFWNVS